MSKKKKLQIEAKQISIPITLGMRLQKISELQQFDKKVIPWDIIRALPNISIFGGQVNFDNDGDSLSREEAINMLELLLQELKSI